MSPLALPIWALAGGLRKWLAMRPTPVRNIGAWNRVTVRRHGILVVVGMFMLGCTRRKGGCYECLKLRHQRTQARLAKEETIWAAVAVLRAWIGKYGVPRVFYTDWKNVYKRKATAGEQMRGKNSGYAAWTHGAEAGHSDRRRQDAPGQGPGGAEPTDPSGSADQETTAERGSIATKPPRTIWKKNICRRTTDGLWFQQLSRRTITVAADRSGTP